LIVPPLYHLGRFTVGSLARDLDPDLRTGLSLCIGFAVLSYVVMVEGFLDSYTDLTFWLTIALPFLLTIPLTLRRIKKLPARWAQWRSAFPLPWDRFLWALIGLLALLDLINAGNAAVGWDAAVHHYAFPGALLRAGGLVDVPAIPFSYYPSLIEMLFTLGLKVGGVFAAGAMTWVFLIPLAVALISLGKSAGSPRIGLWSIILFLGAPLTFETPFSGVIDLPFFTFCILALAVLLEPERGITWGRVVLIGLLIGCASATKHLGLLFLAAFVPVFIWKLVRDTGKFSNSLGPAMLMILLSLLIPLPWYIRSYVLTGDPLYPFLANILNLAGDRWGSFSVESFARTDYPRNLVGFLFYLWHLTMDYWDLRPWYWAVHPAWLALLPPAIVWAIAPPRETRLSARILSLRIILLLAFLTMAINFFLAPAYPRYLFPTWLCLSLSSAWALSETRRHWPATGRILVPIVLALPLVIVLGMAGKRAIEVVPQYVSPDARERAVSESVPGYETFAWANEHLNPRSDVILSIDPKIYYLDTPAIISKPGIESSLIVPWDSQPTQIISNWRDLGVTYFMLDTTLISVKHGFGIAFFSAVLDDRDAVWLDITTTRAGADEFGIGDILSDEEFLRMSALAGLPIVQDGTREGCHLLSREKMEMFQSWGRDWQMARTLLRFINAGILTEEFRSGPGGGLRVYRVHLPPTDDASLPDLPDVTGWCLAYEEGPVDRLPADST